jgi:hypothetical protein
MKTSLLSTLLFLFLIPAFVNAQEEEPVPFKLDKVSLGLGLGLDYGGIGANITAYPTKNLGFFLGGGYAMTGFGYNIGAKARIVPNKPAPKVFPFAMAMYGYNAVISVSGASEYNKIFYGPSVGFGIDLRLRPWKMGYWSVALIVPFRGQEVDDYMNDLEDNHGVDFTSGLIPVAFSIGYRFIVK